MRRRSFSWSASLFIVLLAAWAMVGCRIEEASLSGDVPTDEAPSAGDIRLALVAPVFPPPLGDGWLVLRVSDADDRPIDTAALQIQGNMAHAGMLPVEASAAEGVEGVYRVPVRWTMTGDWIVTVEATTNDGRRATRSFALTVTGEEESCVDGP